MSKPGQWFRTRWRQNRWKDLKHMFWVRGRLEQKDIGSNRIFWFCSECLFSLKCPYNDYTADGWDSKESACNAGDAGSVPGSGRFPWRREWQPTPVFLPGESHGQRRLVVYSTWVERVRHDWVTDTFTTQCRPFRIFSFAPFRYF